MARHQLLIVFVVAFAARVTGILRQGGLTGYFGYDSSVYFGASDALTYGRLPYRDFTLLHPPGLMLALTPLAALTRVISDEQAFTLGNLAFCVLGAVNAVLVVLLCRRLGLRPAAGVAAGLFYALWYGAIGAEYLIRLEPLGNLLLLAAAFAVLAAARSGAGRHALMCSALAGAALGALISVKIWWSVPAVAVLVWLALRIRRRRDIVVAILATATAAIAINLPFFIAAPHAMVRDVLVDQLTRQDRTTSPLLQRLSDISTVSQFWTRPPTPHISQVIGASVLVVLVVGCAARAWLVRAVRPAVVLLAIQLAIVLVAPSWYRFYADFLSVALAVTVGTALGPVFADARAPRWASLRPGWLALAGSAVITVLLLGSGTTAVPPVRDKQALRAAVAHVRCVMSDAPMGQIELNALSRNLADGCPNWIDVTGRSYGGRLHSTRRRSQNPRWQHALVRYLTSGGAMMNVRRRNDQLTKPSASKLHRHGVLVRAGGQTIYRQDGPYAHNPDLRAPSASG